MYGFLLYFSTSSIKYNLLRESARVSKIVSREAHQKVVIAALQSQQLLQFSDHRTRCLSLFALRNFDTFSPAVEASSCFPWKRFVGHSVLVLIMQRCLTERVCDRHLIGRSLVLETDSFSLSTFPVRCHTGRSLPLPLRFRSSAFFYSKRF